MNVVSHHLPSFSYLVERINQVDIEDESPFLKVESQLIA